MNHKTAFYMKVLLNRFHKGSQDSVLNLFSEQGEVVKKTATSETEISYSFRIPETSIAKIHYSWIADKLATVAEGKKALYMAALPTDQQVQIKKYLQIDKDIIPLRGPLKRYIQKEFLELLLPEDHVPLPYIPVTSLSILCHLSKVKLTQIIDFLGLYDLAEEIKKIVDTKLLKNIYHALTQKQKDFLKTCLHQKDKMQTPPFPLTDWNGEPRELEIRLHKRGLVRLAKALSGQHPSFTWTLTRMLDTGRGKRLESMISKEEIPLTTEYMTSKILHLIKFLDKE